MEAPDLRQRVGGERDVDPIPCEAFVELRLRELVLALLDRALERLTCLVGGLADLRALLGRKLCDASRRFGSSALRPR